MSTTTLIPTYHRDLFPIGDHYNSVVVCVDTIACEDGSYEEYTIRFGSGRLISKYRSRDWGDTYDEANYIVTTGLNTAEERITKSVPVGWFEK